MHSMVDILAKLSTAEVMLSLRTFDSRCNAELRYIFACANDGYTVACTRQLAEMA